MNVEAQERVAALKPQSVTIVDKNTLFKSYMPFVEGGGLFIPFNEEVTPQKVFLGQKVFIVLTLVGGKKTPVQGKVVWITRFGFNKGYGVSFGDSAPMRALKENIENILVDMLHRKDPTYTM